MDFVLNIPFLGEFVTGLIVSAVSVKVRNLLHRSTMIVNTKGKKSFDKLPSWVKALAYKGLLEAQSLFPETKQEELLEYVCTGLKTAIKGRLDDIVIDTIKEELKAYLRTVNTTASPEK